MLKTIHAVLFILSLVFMYAGEKLMADSYRGQVNLYYINQKSTDPGSEESTNEIYGLDAGIRFKPVNLDYHPWLEAAFLQKVGGVTGSIARCSIMNGDVNGWNYNGTVDYVTSYIPIYLSLGYTYQKLNGDTSLGGISAGVKLRENAPQCKIGYYFLDNAALAFAYRRLSDNVEFKVPSLTNTIISTTDDFGIAFKMVQELEDQTAINVECAYDRLNSHSETKLNPGTNTTSSGYNNQFAAKIDYYLMQEMSIGGAIILNRGDSKKDESNTYKGLFTVYIIPNLGMGLNYSRVIPKDDKTGKKSSEIFIVVSGRI